MNRWYWCTLNWTDTSSRDRGLRLNWMYWVDLGRLSKVILTNSPTHLPLTISNPFRHWHTPLTQTPFFSSHSSHIEVKDGSKHHCFQARHETLESVSLVFNRLGLYYCGHSLVKIESILHPPFKVAETFVLPEVHPLTQRCLQWSFEWKRFAFPPLATN